MHVHTPEFRILFLEFGLRSMKKCYLSIDSRNVCHATLEWNGNCFARRDISPIASGIIEVIVFVSKNIESNSWLWKLCGWAKACVCVARSSLCSHSVYAIIDILTVLSCRFFFLCILLDNNSGSAVIVCPSYDKRLVYRLLYSLQCRSFCSFRHFSRFIGISVGMLETLKHFNAACTLIEY